MSRILLALVLVPVLAAAESRPWDPYVYSEEQAAQFAAAREYRKPGPCAEKTWQELRACMDEGAVAAREQVNNWRTGPGTTLDSAHRCGGAPCPEPHL